MEQKRLSRLEQQMAFAGELDGLKQIGRQTYLKDASRKENDAEHSWHLALMALLLQEYANEPIDLLRVISMVLLHDVVELDAGDTYAYDDAGNATKRERELAAADRIFQLLPKDQAKSFRDIWDEFEAAESIEAKFAHTLDNIQPMMLNAASDGKAWREHGVRLSQILGRNEHTAEGSGQLWEYGKEQLISPHIQAGAIIDDTKSGGMEKL
ncbi:MAG: HD domain-containing protein [Lachnospiraceae bacterium]|nr:HD domain-containing protein [Lachnospiraceae bacterium]